MKGVKVEKLDEPIINERGSKYLAPSFRADALGIYFRHKGAVSGRHYHKGIDPTKNPERHVLIKGKAKLYVRDLVTQEEETLSMEGPCVWEVAPNIYHEVHALEDLIYLEQRLYGQDDSDVYYLA